MGIGSVKGVEVGFGFKVPEYTAKEINDEYYLDSDKVKTTTNTSGGILGGMSNGMPILLRMAVKLTRPFQLCKKLLIWKLWKMLK